MAVTLRLLEAAHRWDMDDYASTSPGATPIDWGRPVTHVEAWDGGPPVLGEPGYAWAYYPNGPDLEIDFIAADHGVATITGVYAVAGHDTLWTMEGRVDVPGSQLDTGLQDAYLLGGDDTLIGNAWANKLEGWSGNDHIDGGGGTDTAVFIGRMADYEYMRDGAILRTRGPDGLDTLVSVERLEFDDRGLAFDIQGAAGQAYRLYRAALDRAPDLPGLGYQMDALDHGLGLVRLAANFIASPEFQGRYGALNNTQFVTQLYANVLDRAPDAAGLAYHVGHLDAGRSRAEVLVGFSESPENQANVIGQIANGIVYDPLV